MIGLLQGGREHNVEAIAESCGVSRRTTFRDLDALRQAGLPLYFDVQKQRYSIPGTCLLPPTNFTPEEALALIVLCHEMGSQSQLPFFSPARSAVIKLESSLPGQLREQLRRVADAVQIEAPPHSRIEGQQPIYEQLLESVRRRRSVRIQYHSFAESQNIATRLSPYRLLFSRRSWYVLGRSSLHRAVRTFNVARIADLQQTDEPYQIPAGFSLDRYLRNAWHLIPEPGPDREVLIRFQPLVARNVAEVCWHKTQRVEFRPDGSMDFRVTVSGLKEISWWILGYGDQAEVLEPGELRELIARHAVRLAERYRLCESAAIAPA